MNTPVVSIIVPVYNCAQYLHECINSLLYDLNILNIEVLLIDDGSTDESGAICDEYAHKYCQVKVVHTKNQGVSCARNLGIEHALGDWVMFVDGDDKIENNTFDLLLNKASFLQYDMIRFETIRFKDNGSVVKNHYEYASDLDRYRTLIVERGTMLGVCGGIYKRSLFIDHTIRFSTELRYGEDWLVLYKLACYSQSFLYVPFQLYAYRINPCSVTESIVNYVRTDVLEAFRQILDTAYNNNIYISNKSICKAKSLLRWDLIRNLLLSKSKLFKETDFVLNKYVPQSLWNDLRYSRSIKRKIGFLMYWILQIVYKNE